MLPSIEISRILRVKAREGVFVCSRLLGRSRSAWLECWRVRERGGGGLWILDRVDGMS